MEIKLKPDRKLITKQVYIFLTISVLIGLAGLILQLLIPLGEVSPAEAAGILWPIIIGIILVFWIIVFPIILLWIKNLSYIIEDERVTIYKGILSKMQQNIPYRAITDFMLHRSLYDRFLGIGSIRVQTAGQTQSPTGYEGNIAGLVNWQENLEELRSRVREYRAEISSASVKAKPDELSQNELLTGILNELKQIKDELKQRK